jgi:biotin carboxyl carrier protein
VWMKKKYVLNFDGTQHGAVVARQGNKTQVSVDGGEMAPVSSYPVLQGKAIIIRYAGRLHLVHLTGKDSKGTLLATMMGRPIKLSVMDELRAQALDSRGDSAGSGTISADIPGLVVEIKVSVDQVVGKGDPVIVVEAMKMQNELCSAVSGTVVSIPVKEGQAVNPGDALVIVEPEPGD